MYIYSLAIIAFNKANQVCVTAVSYQHSSNDTQIVEQAALVEIVFNVFPVADGFHDHEVALDSVPDEWIREAAVY